MPRPLLLLLFAGSAFAADNAEFFENKIRPVLSKNCYGCHRQAAMGGLRLDSRDAILKGGKSGAAVKPGDPDSSPLIKMISEGRMPPTGGKLADPQIADLRAWIRDGAIWPATAKVDKVERSTFWSFQPVKEPAVPAGVNGIDHFIRARLAQDNLTQAPRASNRTLIRRATIALTGLPPKPEDVDAFLADSSPDAYAKLIDRLLASPQYGERWARHWLDVARYSDDKLNSTQDEPYLNSFRYRDWVIRAFNQDLPYDTFVKAQIAGDLLKADSPEQYSPGLGFYALSPEMTDDRVDATTRGFLALTVACAQCHDHKFDPIPTRDYYSLQGVFSNTNLHELPLAPEAEVKAWKAQQEAVNQLDKRVKDFYETQTRFVGEALAAQTARYLLATKDLAPKDGLDEETLKRWTDYLKEPRQDHPYLKDWFAARTKEEHEKAAREFQELVFHINQEKRIVDDRNDLKIGDKSSNPDLAALELEAIDHTKYVLWRGLFERSIRDSAGFFSSKEGVYFYGRGKVERFLTPLLKAHLEDLKQHHETAKKALPPKYPFLHTITDRDKIADIKVAIRGDRNNPGELAPRAFPQVLCDGEQRKFTQGAGRLELAESIADPKNPLTARVFVNRVWHWHFGRGLVASVSNFGALGEKPSHPELLDWLAARFVKSGWSIKQLHRLILLSDTYQLAAATLPANQTKDPENVLLWRAPRRRLDVETMRDSILAASGQLDPTPGALAQPLDEKNKRRTIYGFVSRRKMDPMLALFDFPSPLQTAETRTATNVPPQRLFLMNSPFVESQSKALADRLTGTVDDKIRQAYRAVYARSPEPAELALTRAFIEKNDWLALSRALLTSNEFLFLD